VSDVPLIHFLLIFDLDQQKLVGCEEFKDADEAAARYAQLERDHRQRGDRVEIVLVGADSIETLRQTHGNYFGLDRILERVDELVGA
jgi:hypothetical protein